MKNLRPADAAIRCLLVESYAAAKRTVTLELALGGTRSLPVLFRQNYFCIPTHCFYTDTQQPTRILQASLTRSAQLRKLTHRHFLLHHSCACRMHVDSYFQVRAPHLSRNRRRIGAHSCAPCARCSERSGDCERARERPITTSIHVHGTGHFVNILEHFAKCPNFFCSRKQSFLYMTMNTSGREYIASSCNVWA